MIVTPHLIATGPNIIYNMVEMHLQPAQQAAFVSLIPPYNALVYIPCISIAVWFLYRLRRDWIRHVHREPMSGEEVDRLRRRFLQLSTLQVVLALAGWLPGGMFFPLSIDLLVGGVPWQTYAHFFISFALCCVITLIYSYLAIQFLVLRVFLPPLFNAESSRESYEKELHFAGRWLGAFQILRNRCPAHRRNAVDSFDGRNNDAQLSLFGNAYDRAGDGGHGHCGGCHTISDEFTQAACKMSVPSLFPYF